MNLDYKNAGVYDLITKLCEKTVAKYCAESRIPQTQLISKLRSKSYEIILNKSSSNPRDSNLLSNPILALLSYQFVSQENVKNVAEYKRSVKLKKAINTLRSTDFGIERDLVNKTLIVLVGLENSSKQNLSDELFQNPFSFGLLDEMLPKLKPESLKSPQPYSFFPSYIFELQYSLKRQDNVLCSQKSHCYTEYDVESFKSPPPDTRSQSLESIKTTSSQRSLFSAIPCSSPYKLLDIPRLTVPRDLQIPKSESSDLHVKVSYVTSELSVKEVLKSKADAEEILDIWDLAMKIDHDIPDDIWETASKLPPIKERQLIATSSRELKLWRRLYGNRLKDLNVIREKQFIRDIMYLIIGVETKSFPFCKESNCFVMKENLVLEAISKNCIKSYISKFLLVGTYYKRLYNFAYNNITADDHFHNKGLIFEAAREIVKDYLLEFRLKATEIFEESYKSFSKELNCMPTLLQILFHIEPLIDEILTVASIYKIIDTDMVSLPYGDELMSFFFNEISLITHKQTAVILFDSLFSICRVYFKFIERFIFEGELDDIFNEFFVRKDDQYVNSRSKRYWDKGFHIRSRGAIPSFLKPLASLILLCGKSLRLLKLCNPSDPLVLLISSDHPSVRCCSSFEELERQQQLLNVYRTRCLFVSGEPVTFEQILLKKEAEKKAFTEMASLKQTETMEKIIAERKRLAQLIIAEKQHSLRVLEAAIAETKAAKNMSKKRERKLQELENSVDQVSEEIDSKIKDDERTKIMEYYSKLNMEVEKSKIHTDWKIRRLQLDQSRMQLLSSEERNLKREKLELEHQRNESIMAMSIQSDFKSEDDLDNIDNNNGEEDSKTTDSTPSVDIIEPVSDNSEINKNKTKAQNSTDVFSALCNVAKSIFGSKSKEIPCDNEIEMDSQGNIVHREKENRTREETSNDVIGAKLDDEFDNLKYLENKQEALKNKQKVMAHEFGQTDCENNKIKDLPFIKTSSIDAENNIEEEWAFVEAKKNKLKVLGAEFDIIKPEAKSVHEPRTEAQKEALINKLKVLGVEYNLPLEKYMKKEPANIAQEEALQNKIKVLGTDHSNAEGITKREPANIAQEEALRNKIKVLGTEHSSSEDITKKEPANIAQEEAIRNKIKILGSDNSSVEEVIKKQPANIAQEETVRNKNKVLGSDNSSVEEVIKKQPANIAQEEAVRNKNKVLGSDNSSVEEVIKKQPANIAQEEAVRNKNKVLGSDNSSVEEVIKKQPANIAQEEAARNKIKVLGSDYDINVKSSKCDSAKKAGLRLNLKPHSEAAMSKKSAVTPNTGAITPGDMFPQLQLDLETPTTAEMPTDGALTSDIFTPHNEENDLESAKIRQDKDFLTMEGFNFSLIVDDEVVSEDICDIQTNTPDNSLLKNVEIKPVINNIDGSYNLESFDPFGVKNLHKYTKDYFNKMIQDTHSVYTHPAVILKEVQKKPYNNIFSHNNQKEEKMICFEGISTLRACLQRSVMLPLTYQLEVVNNSILTHFLVNLDMYEHLRSLKDYFFLMDGEFSRSICHNLFAKLTKTLNPQELLNFSTLHNILDKALGSSISHVHKFSENLSFTITESPLSFQHSSPDVLQCLSLTYCVDWPLNIILSQEALQRYAKVFQFLIKMRRIFWVLSEDFESLKLTVKLSSNPRVLLRSPQYISAQIYRHTMASLIRALDNYIVNTCILTSWKEFEMDLKKARTLDDLYVCHVAYIKKVLFRCLLNNRSTPVMKILNDIFTVTLKVSRLLKGGEWVQQEPNSNFTHTNFVQIEEFFRVFEKLAKYLHKVVTRLMECGYQRHLVELLTMVNLNGYYDPDKSKEDTNTSLQ